MNKPTSLKSSEKHNWVFGFSSLLSHGTFLLLGPYFCFQRLHKNGLNSYIDWVALLQIRRRSTKHESLYWGTYVLVIPPQHEYMNLTVNKYEDIRAKVFFKIFMKSIDKEFEEPAAGNMGIWLLFIKKNVT